MITPVFLKTKIGGAYSLMLSFAKILFMRLVPLLILFGFILNACSSNNVDEDSSLKKYFDENKVTGSFGMFDNGSGDFTIYNLKRFRDSVYLPASTFKIVNSLIGLETGVVTDDSTVIKWDGITRGRPECDKDMPMVEAFRVSCPPWYQELARRIGQQKMQAWLDTLGYASRQGRFVIKNDLDTFWLNNAARITADEQLGLAKKLYFAQLPFQKRTQEVVKSMMLMESNANYALAYKTGWGTLPNGNQMGWVVGWIEENRHPYFFVLQVESADRNIDMRTVRMNILKSILKQHGFMEGKK
jgi:beta-lactamase class D